MYTYNGENFTLDEIKMILGVEVITDAILAENGITLAEEEGGEDFQQVAVTKDVPAVTGTEDTSKVFPEMELEQEDVVIQPMEIKTSELELQLAATSSDIVSLEEKIEDAGGRWRASSNDVAELKKLKRKRDKEETALDYKYSQEPIDWNNSKTVYKRLEDDVATGLGLKYEWLDFKISGKGTNEITLLNLPGGKPKVLKLDGSQEALDTLDEIKQYDKSLGDTYKQELTLEGSLDKMARDNDVVGVNDLLKNTGYELETYVDPSNPYGVVNQYDLKKDGELVAVGLTDIKKELADNSEILKNITTQSYEEQKAIVQIMNAALVKKEETITQDPKTKLSYLEEEFQKSIIDKLEKAGIELTEEETLALQDHFDNVSGANKIYSNAPQLRGRKPTTLTVDQQIKAYEDLSGLPEELKRKILESGFNKKESSESFSNYIYKQVQDEAETTYEKALKESGKQTTIRLAQRFIGLEEEAFNNAQSEKIEDVIKLRDSEAKIYVDRAKQIVDEVDLEGVEFELLRVGGSTQFNIKINRSLTKLEKEKVDRASEKLIDLQYVINLSQENLEDTYKNIQTDQQLFYTNQGGVDLKTFNIAAKEYGLVDVLGKDLNDSFASLALSIPTLFNSDWATLEQQRLNDKNKFYETMVAYDDGDFLKYALRTGTQQSANIVTAIATGSVGGALNLSRTAAQLAIGSVFGVSSGTQTFRDLTSQNNLYDLAKLRGEQATRARDKGNIGAVEYTQIMQDVNNTLAMGKLSNNQIMEASFANGVIEGGVMSIIGQAPNTLKLLKDFKTPSNIAEISRNLFNESGATGKILNMIGKPLVMRPAGEVIEELGVYGLQQYITEYGILDRELDLSQWDDTVMAAITTAGLSQSPGIAYSGMITYGKTKTWEKKINGIKINNQNLSQLIQNTKNEADREQLLFSMSENLAEMGLETDMLSVDILNLGADNVKRLIGNSLIKQDVLARAGVPPGSSDVKTAKILNAYKSTLSPQQLEDFDNQLNAIDTQISKIKKDIESPGNYKLAKKSLGNIYDQYDARFEREGVVFKSDREKLAKIIQAFRQDMTDSNIERAKQDSNIVETVESKKTEDGKDLSKDQKEALYAKFGRIIGDARGRAVSNKLNINKSVESIFEKGSNIEIVAWDNIKDLEEILAKEKMSPEDRADAFSKLRDNKTFGLIVNNKLITQNEDQAREDLGNGEIRAGTVILHELSHAIDDARITTDKGRLDYASNLFQAASTSDKEFLRALHDQTMKLLNGIYGERKIDVNGKEVNMTFENSETFRDEYTKYLQEQVFAYEDQLQLEKDESFLVRAFNDLTTNANSLNTPKKALDYMIANNSAFRRGKLSRKSQRALKNRKSGELKTSEKNTVNKLAVDYKQDKDAFMENPEKYGDLFMQFQSVALDAMGYNVGKGDIAAEDAMGFVGTEFASIMKNYKPVVDGNKVAFTTYVTNVFKMGRGNKFYKQELESKEGRTSITGATESTRLVSTDTAESGLELEERKAKEAKARKKLINPLSAKEIGTKKKAIEDAVVITPAMAPIADFKSISKDYGGKVAGIIFDVPEAKITDGTKNLTYAKKIVDGVPEPSEAGNIQNLYSDAQVLARDIRLLPDTNVTSEESRVGEQGEKVPVTRDVQGRSLGLPNRIIKYFYEDTGKRSKGTTSQTKVYRKKAKFDNPTPQVLKEVQREMGITPAGQLNQYNRTIGQFLKGFAKVKGSVAAVAVAKNKVAKLDTKTSKGAKQIEADIGSGRSKVQFSETGKKGGIPKRIIDLALKFEEISKTSRLLDSPVFRSTIKMMNADGIFTVADMKNRLGIEPKPGDDRLIKKSGYRVLSGQLDAVGSILNKFLETNPRHYKILKESLTNGTSVGLFGTVEVFKKYINEPAEIKQEVTRYKYTIPGKKNIPPRQKDKFIEETKKPNFVKDQYARLSYFESFWRDVETFLKEGDNMSYAWVWQELLVDTVDNMKSLNRIAPPVLYVALDENGNPDSSSGIREEHNFPSNNVGTLMFWAAMNGEIDNAMKVVRAAYMQGPIFLTDDRRIDATSVEGQSFAKKVSGGLSVNMPDFFWKTVVPRILSGDLVIPDGLAAVTRLSAAKVNLDSYKFLPEDMTMSEYFFGTNGVPTETKLKGIATQDQIIKEFFSGEITLKEARAKGKQAVAVIKKLEESFKPEAPVKIEFNNAADKAMANARDSAKYSEKPRKARVFDFDDTLAQSNSMVIVNKPNPEGGFSEGSTKLKAIFMVGGPGAGKTNVGKGLQLGRRGYKVVNQDIALEAMKSEAGLPGDESGYTAEQRSMRSKLGSAARKAAVAKFDKYADAGNGMVIDGTGASYNATTKKIKALQDKGFEVHMVVANTPLETALERNRARKERSLPDFVVRKTYDQVQESLAKYKQDFGGRLYEINTENIQYGKPLPKDFLDQVYAGINSTKVERINATEFALEAGNLEQQGATFNFSEFSKVIDGKKGPLFDVAKFISEAKGQRDMFVLTARPADSAPAIKEFLDSLGLNIPIENIIGLADGKAQAKADWFIQKYSEGYNDFYFADDALKNVKAVKAAFDVLDVKSQVQQARVKFSEKMSTEFNDMIERNKGIKSQATFSDVQARRRGTKQKKYSFFIPPSADDFRGLTQYTFAGKGKQGEADQEFFDKALIRPYQAGIAAINRAKFRIRTDYGALVKNNKKIAKRLKNTVAGTNHTLDEAIRVYLWNKEGYDIPGMSKRDVDALVSHVESGKNGELIAYAEGVKLVTRKDAYPEPTEYWDGSTILGDLNNIATETNRAEYLKEFIDNSNIIFSEQNLNKVEAVYGFRVRESIENILYRMETGQNKAKGTGRIVNEWNDWVNNSVGAIMFFNRRSALMQTLSTVNFVNWSDNNPIKAAAAFANQPQYWKDFITLWSSPKLVARRKGLESDIQEAEIARAAKKGGVKGVISYLLKIGFTPTQLADSFAIASGGATFYRNRIKSYLKETNDQGEKVYTKEQAEQKAFEDFSSIAEETQQSGDPMLVSQQQASVLGRLVLAFQNTPMQYTRLIKKAGQDLINRRGNPMTHMSKIVYYGFVQNLIFSTLQNALFALIPGFDDEEEDFATDKEREKYLEKQQRKEDKKIVRVANSMVDTLLRGSGLAGAVISTIKNVIMAYQKYDEAPLIQKENADIILAALNISPPIGSKARKINNVLQTMQFEKDVLAERGFSVMIDGHFQLSPAYDMLGDATSATLNLPLDRLADEVNAITEALDTRNTQWQRIALALGWRQWDVGARVEEHDLIKTEAKAKRKIEGKAKAKETRAKNKKIRREYLELKEHVFFKLPDSLQAQIRKNEESTRNDTPTYKLKELAEKYNIDISDYE